MNNLLGRFSSVTILVSEGSRFEISFCFIRNHRADSWFVFPSSIILVELVKEDKREGVEETDSSYGVANHHTNSSLNILLFILLLINPRGRERWKKGWNRREKEIYFKFNFKTNINDFLVDTNRDIKYLTDMSSLSYGRDLKQKFLNIR